MLEIFELSEIKVIWSVCNSITGICNDFGTSHNMGPFIVLANDGEGLKIADYVTLSVDAVDSKIRSLNYRSIQGLRYRAR